MSVIPTPDEVAQQICGITGLGRALFWVMKKEQEFLQAWGVEQQQQYLGGTKLALEFFSVFQDFAKRFYLPQLLL